LPSIPPPNNYAAANFIIQYAKIPAFIMTGAKRYTLTVLSTTFLHS